MNLLALVADCLARHKLAGTTGIIAVSGGPDSVALAHLFATLLHAGAVPRLILAHVNHQLRGAESDADEAFVQKLPAAWQNPGALTCRVTRIDAAKIARTDHDNLESVGRRERYDWLARVAVEEKAAWVATGHTADDQAETVLFRLLRGSGVLGLGAMQECRPLDGGVHLVRPLLPVRRQTLLDYLCAQQIGFRLDSSNRDLRFMRNRLRLKVIPQIEQEFNPSVVDVLCRLAAQSREWYTEIAAEAQGLLTAAELPRAGRTLVFSASKLKDCRPNLVREMFRLVWQREGWPMADMDFERWDRLAVLAAGACPAWDFPGRVHARRVGAVLQLQRESFTGHHPDA